MGIISNSSISAKQTNQIVAMKFLVIVSACLAVTAASHPGLYAGYAGYTGPLADIAPAGVPALVAHPNGAVTPADTPSVLAARADHLAAKGAIYGSGYGLAAPALPAVAAAPVAVAAPAFAAAPVAAPIVVAAPVTYGYTGPLADSLPASAAGLVSLPNGAVVPKDTPSVVAARADHLAAKGAIYAATAPIVAAGPAIADPALPVAAPALPVASPAYAIGAIPVGSASPTGALVSFPNGAVVPADEPAVVAARADHLATKGGLGW